MKIINIRRCPGKKSGGILSFGSQAFPCAIGRGGISARKREGDGATPIGMLALQYGYRKKAVNALPSRLRLVTTRSDLGWCDAPCDPNYNRPVRLPFKASHESMLRPDHLYDVCIVLDWNLLERRRNRGSAIFLHIARPGFLPTEGCVAVSPTVMKRLLPYLSRETRLRVVG